MCFGSRCNACLSDVCQPDKKKRSRKGNGSKFKAFSRCDEDTDDSIYSHIYSQVLYTDAGTLTLSHTHTPTHVKPSIPAASLSHPETNNLTHTCTPKKQSTYDESAASAQYVQVDRRGFGQALEHAVDLLDVQPHVGLPLPAAQHEVVHLLGAGAGPLQHAALGDALDHLQGEPIRRQRPKRRSQRYTSCN